MSQSNGVLTNIVISVAAAAATTKTAPLTRAAAATAASGVNKGKSVGINGTKSVELVGAYGTASDSSIAPCHGNGSTMKSANEQLFDAIKTTEAIKAIKAENAPSFARDDKPYEIFNPNIPPRYVVEGMASFWNSTGTADVKANLPSPVDAPLIHGTPIAEQEVTRLLMMSSTFRELAVLGVAAAAASEAQAKATPVEAGIEAV